MTVQAVMTDTPVETVVVNFESDNWKCLHLKNLSPFKIEEPKRFCDAYPDGMFPNATESDKEKQTMLIQNFNNYIEYTKIVRDEVCEFDNKQYLTTLYYERRGTNWLNKHDQKKEGDVVGYCINGFTYHPEDLESVNKLIYGIVYYSLVANTNEFKQLITFLQQKKCLVFCGADEIFMQEFRKLLLEKSAIK